MRECHQAADPWAELAAAICGQAADDFRAARADRRRAERSEEECRAFFRSNACELLCDGDGRGLLRMIEREPPDSAKWGAGRVASRRLREAVARIVAECADAVAEAAAALGADAPPRLADAAARMPALRDAAEALARPPEPTETTETSEQEENTTCES